MSYPPVKFWAINKGEGKPKMQSSICFAPLRHKIPQAVRFMAYTTKAPYQDRSLSDEAVDFWLGFTKRMLKRPECPKFTLRKLREDRIVYRLETKGLTYEQALLYLTWFRYPQEFPDIVIEFHSRKEEGDDDEKLFSKLQSIHTEARNGKVKIRWDNMIGHGLIYNYYDPEGSKGISIAKFVENIKANKGSVQSHFT